MATVRFSEDLLQKIKDNASNTFDTRLKKVYGVEEGLADRIYDHVFKDYYASMNALPKEFMEQVGHIHISHFGDVLTNVQLNFASPRPLPKGYHAGFKFHSSWNNQHVKYNMDYNDPVDVELHTYFYNRQTNIKVVEKQRDEFVGSVLTVCASFTTLAPALKAWPPLWDLLPEGTKNRHLEVSERKSAAIRAENLMKDVDLSRMTATVVATKLVR